MKNNCMSQKQLVTYLNSNFSFYNDYITWLEGEKGSDDNFRIKDTYCLVELPHKSLSTEEKYGYISNAKKSICDVLITLGMYDTRPFLVLNEFNHDEFTKIPWIVKSYRKNLLVKNSTSIFTNGDKKKSYWKICSSRGFECYGEIVDVIESIFYLPFLMGYMDINILFPEKKRFIKIDHHLMLSQIELTN